ncbi:Dynein light chain [Macleaya cordata]|uniref:Dynein light chain n=1 Tax=Macleaya cordata TaxID=56857 RepID=A0A200QNA1_MACCD|nr:Dynein light chain [Macleaya cordata]
MDPTRKKYLPTTTPPPSPPPNPNGPKPIPCSTLINYTRTKAAHNHPKRVSNHKAPPPSDPPLVHTPLHPKFLTLSLDAASNSSLGLLNKTHHLQPSIKQKTTRGNNMEKQRKSSQTVEKKIKTELIRGRGGERKLIEERKRPSLSNSPLIGGGGGGGGGGGERRRSSWCSDYCYSEIELGEFFSSLGARIVTAEMPPFMQTHAVTCARNAYDSLDKFSSKTLASTLKKEFDGVYGPAWHCIVGTSFGTFVTHSVGGFLYFSLDHHHHHHHNKLYFLLFKTTVKRSSDN